MQPLSQLTPPTQNAIQVTRQPSPDHHESDDIRQMAALLVSSSLPARLTSGSAGQRGGGQQVTVGVHRRPEHNT